MIARVAETTDASETIATDLAEDLEVAFDATTVAIATNLVLADDFGLHFRQNDDVHDCREPPALADHRNIGFDWNGRRAFIVLVFDRRDRDDTTDGRGRELRAKHGDEQTVKKLKEPFHIDFG